MALTVVVADSITVNHVSQLRELWISVQNHYFVSVP